MHIHCSSVKIKSPVKEQSLGVIFSATSFVSWWLVVVEIFDVPSYPIKHTHCPSVKIQLGVKEHSWGMFFSQLTSLIFNVPSDPIIHTHCPSVKIQSGVKEYSWGVFFSTTYSFHEATVEIFDIFYDFMKHIHIPSTVKHLSESLGNILRGWFFSSLIISMKNNLPFSQYIFFYKILWRNVRKHWSELVYIIRGVMPKFFFISIYLDFLKKSTYNSIFRRIKFR